MATLQASEVRPLRSESTIAVTARPTEVPRLAEVVERARRGDAEAFDAITRAGIDRSFRLAMAILRSEPDARDAVQDAYLAAWRRLPSLREPDRFEAWLDRILVNACRMQLRHGRVVRLREVPVNDVFDRGQPGRASEVDTTDHVADVELVRAALGRLEPDERIVVVLHHLEDRPVAEIASVLGIPEGTVKWRLHEARAALARILGEDER